MNQSIIHKINFNLPPNATPREVFVNNIKNYVCNVLNSANSFWFFVRAIKYENNSDAEETLDFIIEEVIDRTSLYLNREDVYDLPISRILAQVVNTHFSDCMSKYIQQNDMPNKEEMFEPRQIITSISDNGQTVNYSAELIKHFTSTSDKELFTGFTSVLSRYRRVKVV